MYVIITTSTDSKKVAEKISNLLINKKLSPCVTFENVNSRYIWENSINKCKEIKISIKSKMIYKEQVSSIIKKHHNYKVPDISCQRFYILDKKYKNWFIEYFINEN